MFDRLKIKTYFEYLSLLHLDKERESWSTHFLASNTGSNLSLANRVFIPSNICPNDFNMLKVYYGSLDFTFWVCQTNDMANQYLLESGAELVATYPMMRADLKNISPAHPDSRIKIQQLFLEKDILNIWAPLVIDAYKKINLSEFQKFIAYLLSTSASSNLRFYIGLYCDTPCATSMIGLRDGVVDLHWVGTSPDYRKKGMGYAIVYSDEVDH
jgi:hypothetical protein